MVKIESPMRRMRRMPRRVTPVAPAAPITPEVSEDKVTIEYRVELTYVRHAGYGCYINTAIKTERFSNLADAIAYAKSLMTGTYIHSPKRIAIDESRLVNGCGPILPCMEWKRDGCFGDWNLIKDNRNS